MGLTKPRAYQIFDIDYKQSVRVVTVSNVTLSGGAPSQVDGVTLSLNDRVLVTGQSTGSQNGLYYVTTVGSGSNGTWARSQDGNQTGEIEAGMIIMVTEGATYANTQWKLTTNDPIVIGTTALTFVQNYSVNSISAGTSNVVVNSNANVTVSSAGTANVLVVTSTGANVTGYLTASGNISGGNISTAGQASATGNITGGNINAVGGTFTGNVAFGNIFVGGYYYANGTVFSGGGGGTPGGANTQIQFNDNGVFVGTAGLTFNKTTNAVSTTGTLSATGNITGGNIVGTLNGSGANVTSISATNISTGTLAQARLANASVTLGSTALTLGATVTTVAGLSSVTSTTFVGALSGAATTAGTVTTAAQPNITSVGTLSSLTVTGNVTGGNLITAGLVSLSSITKTGSNGVGNIGSSTSTFNTIFAKATSAQYADLAEMYVSDQDYPPGTVVEFGGEYEITISSASHSTAVAGIVSTNPSYLMNSTQQGEHVLPIALTGRVPCRVQGPVRKGDVLVSSNIPGVAQRIGMNWQPGCVLGKSMEVIDSAEIQTIEVAVGRL